MDDNYDAPYWYDAKLRHSILKEYLDTPYYQAHPYGFWDWVESLTHKKADWVIILICLITITAIIILHKMGYIV